MIVGLLQVKVEGILNFLPTIVFSDIVQYNFMVIGRCKKLAFKLRIISRSGVKLEKEYGL